MCNKLGYGYSWRTKWGMPVSYTHLDVYKRQTTESTFANHLIEANHTYKNIDNNRNILHVHTKGRKPDTLEQLEIYKHTKTNKNDILNEQTQFKSHALFKHISPHTHSFKMCIRDRPVFTNLQLFSCRLEISCIV